VGVLGKVILGAASGGFVASDLTIARSVSASGDSLMSEYLFCSWVGRFKMLFTLGSVGDTTTLGMMSSVPPFMSSPFVRLFLEVGITVGL
jgi:hypothetical protein